jgi:hypothetical protein
MKSVQQIKTLNKDNEIDDQILCDDRVNNDINTNDDDVLNFIWDDAKLGTLEKQRHGQFWSPCGNEKCT